jgi:hypothetical protein
MNVAQQCSLIAVAMLSAGVARAQGGQIEAAQVTVQWERPSAVVHPTPSLQVVSNPLLRPGSLIQKSAFAALEDLQADYVRFVPWYPYPKLAVAELQRPRAGRTSWDFSLIDPVVDAFFAAAAGRPTILNFSTQPAWMFRHGEDLGYPANPDEASWTYSDSPGGELVDPTGRELAQYYARVVSWYSRGGFEDEYGRYHRSGHRFRIPYWEVLNEPDGEHAFTAKQYTDLYDAIVAAISKVSPGTKFAGLGLADAHSATYAEFFEYFLDPRNHRPHTPLDMISLHFYASPTPTESLDQWQYSFFTQAEDFIARARFIDLIRKRLSPSTRIIADEVGSILPGDKAFADPAPIPGAYWNLSAAFYAYLYTQLAQVGVDVINESQLVGYPSNFPEVSMIDWKNGKPNARYWVVKLLRDRIAPGDAACDTEVTGASPDHFGPGVAAQGYRSANFRKILIINKRNRPAQVTLDPEAVGGRVETVDESSGEGPPTISTVESQQLMLRPFAVAVVDFQSRTAPP